MPSAWQWVKLSSLKTPHLRLSIRGAVLHDTIIWIGEVALRFGIGRVCEFFGLSALSVLSLFLLGLLLAGNLILALCSLFFGFLFKIPHRLLDFLEAGLIEARFS